MGIVVRNLLLSCEYLYDNPLHLFVLSGPDYSETLVKQTNPEIWAKAETAPARGRAIHGYATMGAIMTDLNPLTGKLYLEALQMTRVAREAYVLLGGKYPTRDDHPRRRHDDHHDHHLQRVLPEDLAVLRLREEVHRDLGRRVRLLPGVRSEIRRLRKLPATMIDLGQWDHEDYYDATYANCNAWGEKRWSTPAFWWMGGWSPRASPTSMSGSRSSSSIPTMRPGRTIRSRRIRSAIH